MYDIKLTAASGSDWAEQFEATNADTNQPLADIDTALIEMNVRDRGDSTVLSASTADSTITRPATGKFQWKFTKEQMASLCPGTTYRVGCRMTTDGGTISLFIGSLAYLDGEVS